MQTNPSKNVPHPASPFPAPPRPQRPGRFSAEPLVRTGNISMRRQQRYHRQQKQEALEAGHSNNRSRTSPISATTAPAPRGSEEANNDSVDSSGAPSGPVGTQRTRPNVQRLLLLAYRDPSRGPPRAWWPPPRCSSPPPSGLPPCWSIWQTFQTKPKRHGSAANTAKGVCYKQGTVDRGVLE